MSESRFALGALTPAALLAVLCGVAFAPPRALAGEMPGDAASASSAASAVAAPRIAMPAAQGNAAADAPPSPDTVIVPRPLDDTRFVRIPADGVPDALSLAEATPDEPTAPLQPEAAAVHALAPAAPHMELSLGYEGAHLTNGYGDWYGMHLRGLYQANGRTFLGELAELHRFGENTQLGAITYLQDLGPDWFTGIGFGGTTRGTILPSARVDVSINRKLLADRSLIASLGAGYAWSRSGHRDQLYHAGLIWYAIPKWIFEAGMNYIVDSPGSVKAPQYYAAVTYGEVGKSLIVVRGGIGREAYQVTGAGTQIADFRSHEVSAKWRYWITKQWSAQVELDYYHNPYYSRYGGEVGVTYQW
ncbi:YaiO family outer membrane beta-barrel protein [Burkholderia guangdongensis]|uniref:YaiO family outer membrane beta-barrel protein n=1 Tax=Burkholderia guangdongensis TaxID=1792500 RepID=UPI0015CED74F|nr:YaiO family outer membrane beta-barrel protein [Burkholderia guangdongensis]